MKGANILKNEVEGTSLRGLMGLEAEESQTLIEETKLTYLTIRGTPKEIYCRVRFYSPSSASFRRLVVVFQSFQSHLRLLARNTTSHGLH